MKKFFTLSLVMACMLSATYVMAQAPANDDCMNAVALTIAPDEASCVSVNGTTLNGTASGAATGSPSNVCSGSWFSDDVWYSFTTGAMLPAGGIVVKGTFGANTTDLTAFSIGIYTTCDTAASNAPIACNSTCDPTQNSMTLFPAALMTNTTYYVRVWSGCSPTADGGTFSICAYEAPPSSVTCIWGTTAGEGDFDMSLNNWTNVDVNGGSDAWIWVADGTAIGAFRSTTISSPTVNNGAALFDADYMTTSVNPNPTQPYPNHNCELISPMIDVSAYSEVGLKFYQSYDALNGDTYISFSTDGGQTWSNDINVNDDIAANTSTPSLSTKRYILPGAGGSSMLQVKFRGDMDFYNWILDDVCIFDASNFHNTVIGANFTPNATQVPLSQADTIFFGANITNNGGTDATNVTLVGKVIDLSNNSVLFTDSVMINTLPIAQTDSFISTTSAWVPDALGNYRVTYELYQDSTDVEDGDNYFQFDYTVTDSTFANDNSTVESSYDVDGTAVASGGIGNVYLFNNAENNAKSLVSFAMNNPQDLGGQTMSIIIYRLDANNDGDIDEDGDQAFTITDIQSSIVGLSTYTFNGTEPQGNGFITVEVDNFLGSVPISYDANAEYLVFAEFSGAATATYTLSGAPTYTPAYLNTVVYDGTTWFTGGFSSGRQAMVRLDIPQININTENRQKLEHALNVFPNPASNFVNVNVNLEAYSEAEITISDVSGKIMNSFNYDGVKTNTYRYDVSNYASGTYFMTIVTPTGYQTTMFVVSK